jgi:hypothetical protein
VFVRYLLFIALLNCLLVPAAMMLVGVVTPLVERASAAYFEPVSALLVAIPLAVLVARRAGALGLSRFWSAPMLVWAATTSTFGAAAPVAILLMVVSGHVGAGLEMLASAYAPLALMIFLALYQPTVERWRGQGMVMRLVWGGAVAETLLGLPRTLRVVGGWFNLLSLSNPSLGPVAGGIFRARDAVSGPIMLLQGYEQAIPIVPLPLHALVFCAGLLVLMLEGDWGLPVAEEVAGPVGRRRS